MSIAPQLPTPTHVGPRVEYTLLRPRLATYTVRFSVLYNTLELGSAAVRTRFLLLFTYQNRRHAILGLDLAGGGR